VSDVICKAVFGPF